MTVFKNRHGFGIIEAMMAIAIIGLTVAPMLILDTEVFTRVSNLTERFHRFLFAKNFIFKAQEREPFQSVNYSTQEKEEKPSTMLHYTLKAVAKESSLSSVQQLYKQEVQAAGMIKSVPPSTIVQFIYKPQEDA